MSGQTFWMRWGQSIRAGLFGAIVVAARSPWRGVVCMCLAAAASFVSAVIVIDEQHSGGRRD